MSSHSSTRYLWAADPQAAWIPADKLVENRYHVMSPQLWLDTKSTERPEALWPLPDRARPYAHLSRYRLHLPQLYGFCSLGRAGNSVEIPLLDNVPIDINGALLPALTEVWPKGTALQQIHWLWQIVNLWQPLVDTGVGYSLLDGKNIRVQDWRIRLCELLPDAANPAGRSNVVGLAGLWQTLVPQAQPAVVEAIEPLMTQMQVGKIAVADLALAINDCLLTQAAALPLTVTIAGGTDPGNDRHNEDSYYPQIEELGKPLSRHLGIVCDGVAGHEGGEVASQMAVQSLQLQMQVLLQDIGQETEMLTPTQLIEHIQAVLRVVNNLISNQNDEQNRQSRRRMATTLVMAMQLPQQVRTPKNSDGTGNSHEIYIAHVGDSRAYWITRNSCQLLTVDDDVAQREVQRGKSMPWQAAGRIDAGSLTQALGMKDSNNLQPMVQRLMAIEDGVLLLCSDGLSDRRLIERSWSDYVPLILDGELPLDMAVAEWIQQARMDNGHDNTSLVLMHYNVSPPKVQEEEPIEPEVANKPLWLQKIIQNFLLIEIIAGVLVLLIVGGYFLQNNPLKKRSLLPSTPTINPINTNPVNVNPVTSPDPNIKPVNIPNP
jgi:protein phosphatase